MCALRRAELQKWWLVCRAERPPVRCRKKDDTPKIFCAVLHNSRGGNNRNNESSPLHSAGGPTSHLVCQSSETEGEDLSPDVGIPLLDQRDSLYDRNKKGRFRAVGTKGLNEAAQGGGRASSASSAGRTDAKRRKWMRNRRRKSGWCQKRPRHRCMYIYRICTLRPEPHRWKTTTTAPPTESLALGGGKKNE